MAHVAVDATAVGPAAKGNARSARGAVEALLGKGVDVVALVQPGVTLEAPPDHLAEEAAQGVV